MYYDIEAIKSRLSITDTCDHLGISMKRCGINYSIPCPNPAHCEHKHDNCFVFPASGRFKCFSCGAGGDIIGLIMTYKGYDFKDAAEYAAEISGCGSWTIGRKTKDILRLISSDECDFLHIRNEPVSKISEICDSHSVGPANRSGCCDDEGNNIIVLKTAVSNPLRSLWEKDPKAYKELIRNKAYERIAVYKQIGEALNCDMSGYLKKAADLFMGFGGMYDKRKNECLEYV